MEGAFRDCGILPRGEKVQNKTTAGLIEKNNKERDRVWPNDVC
jgi:hypothetical protein